MKRDIRVQDRHLDISEIKLPTTVIPFYRVPTPIRISRLTMKSFKYQIYHFIMPTTSTTHKSVPRLMTTVDDKSSKRQAINLKHYLTLPNERKIILFSRYDPVTHKI